MVAFLKALPLFVFLGSWELYVRVFTDMEFFFGRPTEIAMLIAHGFVSGILLVDFFVTFLEVSIGFVAGTFFGTVVGMTFWFSSLAFRLARPYIIALGSTPVFALAPLLIIWFGTGIFAKIIIVILSTFFISLYQSYNGVLNVDRKHAMLLHSMGATSTDIFLKVVVPTSFVWVLAGLKINVGFAILGAFIGEFISSERGLGHMILVASGLFNISQIFVGIIGLMVIAIFGNWLIDISEQNIKRLLVRLL